MSPFDIPDTEAKRAALLEDNIRRYWDNVGHRISKQSPEVRLAIAKVLEQWIVVGPERGTPMYENDPRVVPAEMLLAPVQSVADEAEVQFYLAQIRAKRPPGPRQPISG